MYREIGREIRQFIKKKDSRMVLILGLRQTGKTTLAKRMCEGRQCQFFNFDLLSDQREFSSVNRHSLADFHHKYKDSIIIVDEVQKMPEATEIIKHLHDQYGMKFILTGSSELKIKKNFGDTLAGRVKTWKLYPLSLREILTQKEKIGENSKIDYENAQIELQKYLVYGSLPAVQNIEPGEYASFLKEFTETLLSKDILEISDIRKSTKIYALARFLAMQVGQLVNVNELAMLIETTRPTVYNYLDILEQMNIIIRAHPISTNERKSISEKFKVYFTDIGMRNSLIGNFEGIQTRMDTGAIMENASYVGIKRRLDYQGSDYKMGFFRSKTGSEIDIVVKKGKKEYLYEVKTARKNKRKGAVEYIDKENVWEYL